MNCIICRKETNIFYGIDENTCDWKILLFDELKRYRQNDFMIKNHCNYCSNNNYDFLVDNESFIVYRNNNQNIYFAYDNGYARFATLTSQHMNNSKLEKKFSTTKVDFSLLNACSKSIIELFERKEMELLFK